MRHWTLADYACMACGAGIILLVALVVLLFGLGMTPGEFFQLEEV